MRLHRNEVTDKVNGNVGLHERCPCYPDLLREVDYNVGLSGKWHAGNSHDFGFDGPHLPGWFYPRENALYLEYLDEQGLPPLSGETISDRFPVLESALAAARDDRPDDASFTLFVTKTALDKFDDYASDYHEDGSPFYQCVHYFRPHNSVYLPEPDWSMCDSEVVEFSESVVKEHSRTNRGHTATSTGFPGFKTSRLKTNTRSLIDTGAG